VGTEPTSPPTDDLTRAVYAVARGARMLEHRLSDMTLPQVRVLRLIATAPDRASALAERAAVSRPSLTGVLDGLEAKGWIRRADVDGDRRGVRLEATPAGRAALAEEEGALTGHLAAVLEGASATERKRVLDGLVALGAAMERWHAEQQVAR
jgi:DNA-binding MarR family transcriptional regulator